MTLSSSSLSIHSTLTQAFLAFKTLFKRSLPGWLLIVLVLAPLRLNFYLSDSKTNLPKYTTLYMTPPTLLEILALSLMNIFLTKLHLSPKLVTITFVNFAVCSLISIRQPPVPLLPLSSTPNLLTVILSTIKSLTLNYPISSRSRTLLLILSLKLLNPIISLPCYALCTGSGSLNASNSFTLLSLTYKVLTTTQLPYLHNLMSIQRPCSTRSSSSLFLVSHFHHHL